MPTRQQASPRRVVYCTLPTEPATEIMVGYSLGMRVAALKAAPRPVTESDQD